MTKDEALKHISELTLSQFMGPHHMALECVSIARKALEQPEPEPMAWRNAAIRVGEDLYSVGPFGYYDMTAEQWLDWALSVVTVHASPPKREPLTIKQISSLWDEIIKYAPGDVRLKEFARAIEAAHGIGENHDIHG